MATTVPDQILPGRLGSLPLSRQVLNLALWPFLEQILSFAVGTVDLVFAGRMATGAERVVLLDALGLGGYLSWLMMIIQSAVAGGVMAIVSRAAGKGNQAEADDGLVQGILVGGVVGTSSGILLYLLIPWTVSIFGLADAAAVQAGIYLRIVCLTCPLLGFFYACTYALRAVGDTRSPFFIILAVNLTNIALSWAFVFGPFGNQGIAGLAWGSVAAWTLGLVLILSFLYRKPAEIDSVTVCLAQVHWRFRRRMSCRILKVAWPQGLDMTGMWFINALTVGLITRMPFEGSLGAHFIGIRVESMSFLPGYAIGTAGAALVGQYLGAQRPDQAARVIRTSSAFAATFMALIGLSFILFPAALVQLILPGTDSEARLLVEKAAPLVFLCGFFQPAFAVALVVKNCLRGAGDTRTVMLYSYLVLIFYRALVIPIGILHFHFNLQQVWFCMMLDIATQALVFWRVFRKGRWQSLRV